MECIWQECRLFCLPNTRAVKTRCLEKRACGVRRWILAKNLLFVLLVYSKGLLMASQAVFVRRLKIDFVLCYEQISDFELKNEVVEKHNPDVFKTCYYM